MGDNFQGFTDRKAGAAVGSAARQVRAAAVLIVKQACASKDYCSEPAPSLSGTRKTRFQCRQLLGGDTLLAFFRRSTGASMPSKRSRLDQPTSLSRKEWPGK